MGTRPSTSISVPSSPTAPSPVLAPMPPAHSLPRADEASQSPAKSILNQLDYLPTSSILTQLGNVSETHEDYALKQQSLGISARQDLEAGAYEDHSAETESQYPINPLPEAQGLYSPESANQSDSNLAQGDCEIGSKAQRCQMDASDDHDDHSGGAHIDTEYCPATANSGERGGQEDGVACDANDPTEQSPRKRRKVRHDSATTKPQRCSSNVSRFPPMRKVKYTSARSMPSPPASHDSSEDGNVGTSAATFEEWPLQNVIFKRVIVDGVGTFQLQFEWPFCTSHSQGSVPTGNARRTTTTRATGGQAGRTSGTRARFTREEDNLLTKLRKEQGNLSWAEIHKRFNDTFPGRSRGCLQVHYCTKLKHSE
ncbi:hypothetical protein HRG_010019 [Hirsutella rhossiliensis]|uniref:Myb-like domain-containing protein n=1 Tax=Hirsutella rhossiliensis TaxID=111463 RepID=A0A9P8MPW2_9HYPO|nr:uncharacterized protein HRG_10019 [Hirsutella rhossiliensis]KAH0958974.1 hypothetical protein HRG_10019 [Hirsutella rhossiliensis]